MRPASAGLWAVLALSGCLANGPSAEHESAVEQGERWFYSPAASPAAGNTFACSTCHRAVPDPLDTRILPGADLAGVVERPSYWGGQELELLNAINDCRHLFMAAQMPWRADDPAAGALYTFLESLPAPRVTETSLTIPPEARDLPEGDAVAGARIFNLACATCHGQLHTGLGRMSDVIPSLPDDAVAAFEDLGFDATTRRIVFVEKTRHGPFLKLYGVMPPFSSEVLDDSQLADLLTYLELY